MSSSPLVNWLRRVWPHGQSRAALLGEYATLRTLPHFLTDVALRGFVFSPAPAGVDLAIVEGRRQLALEIIKASGEDPQKLWTYVAKAEGKD